MNALVRKWWFGEALVLTICGLIVLAAALLAPTDAAVSLFGVEIPMLCQFRRLTGMGCPGCGLTRSFAYMAHGQVMDAFRLNWLGPPFFAVVAAQVPYRVYRLVKAARR